jgi:hypothetical protein
MTAVAELAKWQYLEINGFEGARERGAHQPM